MPRQNQRQQALKALQALILLCHVNPRLRWLLTLLELAYIKVEYSRYFASRLKRVLRLSSWSSASIDSMDALRARRQIRMDRRTYEVVLDAIRRLPVFLDVPGKKRKAPVELQLQVFLYYLATSNVGGSHEAIAEKFGVGVGSVQVFVKRVLVAVQAMKRAVVSWPNEEERAAISVEIENLSGFRNCVGFIDGTAFRLTCRPQIDGESYFSRKSDYCISGQIVCDGNRLIRSMVVGYPGSVHDSRQWRSMELCMNAGKYFTTGQYLLGDSAYSLSQRLVPPYKKPQSLIHRNRSFNYFLSKSRITVEHTIGIVKERFYRLKDGFSTVIIDQRSHKHVVDLIEAGVVLHNFCILHKDTNNHACLRLAATALAQDQRSQVNQPVEEVSNAELKAQRESIQQTVLDWNSYVEQPETT